MSASLGLCRLTGVLGARGRELTAPLYFQMRQRSNKSRMRYKAAFDDEGNILDGRTRISELQEEIVKSEQLQGVSRPQKVSKQALRNFSPLHSESREYHSPKAVKETSNMEECEADNNLDFDPPRYTKISPWDKKSETLNILNRILSSKRHRQDNSDVVVMEGVRVISDALAVGVTPHLVAFSRINLLKQFGLHNLSLNASSPCKFYHVPYSNIKLWSDLTTPTGLMAAYSRKEIRDRVRPKQAFPLTLVCDNIRTPDNLGAVLRVAAGAGARQVILTRGCTEPWAPKVVRAGAGAHFQIPIVDGVGWEVLEQYLHPFPQVVLSDLYTEHRAISDAERLRILEQLETECIEEGYLNPGDESASESSGSSGQLAAVSRDLSYLDPDLTERYRGIPVPTSPYSDFKLAPGCGETVVVIGGETEGVSNAAYRFCHKYNGNRLFIPLRNEVNSLNVISAASVVMFQLQLAHMQAQAALNQPQTE